MAGWAVGEGGGASEDQLLGLRIADDDGIVVTALNRCISTVPYIFCLFLVEIEAIQPPQILET
jgi:hypothetical protein